MAPPNDKQPQRGKLVSAVEQDGRTEPRAGRVLRHTNPGIAPAAPGSVSPPPLQDAADSESDTGVQSADALVIELGHKNLVIDRLQRELQRRPKVVETEAPKSSGSDSTELRFSARGFNWAKIGAWLSALLGAGGLGLGVRAAVVAPKPQQDVAPVSAKAGELETRVARLEACLGARDAAERKDTDFVEKAFDLLGVKMPRREGDDPPYVIEVEAKALVNPKPGARPMWKITSTRPPRPTCPGK